MLDVFENRAHLGHQRGPCACELHTSWQPTKQLHLELTLEGADLLTERRLLDAELFGSPSDVPFLGNRKEVSQVAQLQDHILDVCDRLPRERTPHPIGETMSSLPRIASYLKNMDCVCGTRWVDCQATSMLKAPLVKEAVMIQIDPTPASIKSLYAAMRTMILAARKNSRQAAAGGKDSTVGVGQ